MATEPVRRLVLIVGCDALSLAVCDELTEFEGQDVVVLWPSADDAFARHLEAVGARHVRGKPSDPEALRRAGVMHATSILLLTTDDHLNLETALMARDLNPALRIVISQFNRTLGAKIESKLENSSVISLAAQSAATFAAVAVDAACFYGVQFPDFTGELYGFAQRLVKTSDTARMTIAEAEEHLEARILAVDDRTKLGADERLRSGSSITTFGPVRSGHIHQGVADHERESPRTRVVHLARRSVRAVLRSDPLIRSVVLSAIAIFIAASIFFAQSLHLDPITAMYFVMVTITTTGYGDIVPHAADHVEQIVAIVVMIAGVVFTAIFVAVLTTEFTKTQWVLQQGLRRIPRRGHIVVCGAGQVGTRVIDFLTGLGVRVVVIEAHPRSAIVERSRDHEFDLLTGDATAETTLALCNLLEAHALIALTDSDTANLEVALGAVEINADLPIILRMAEATFARSIAQHFGLKRTFGTAGLAAPVFAGLSRTAGVRGFVTICGEEFAVSEIGVPGEAPNPVEGRIALVTARDGGRPLVRTLADIRAGERALTLVPVSQFRKSGSPSPDEAGPTHAGMRVDHRPRVEIADFAPD